MKHKEDLENDFEEDLEEEYDHDAFNLVDEKPKKIPKPNFIMPCPYCKKYVSGRIKITMKTCPHCLKKFNKNEYKFQFIKEGDACATFICNKINTDLRKKERRTSNDVLSINVDDLIKLYKQSGDNKNE